MNKSIVPAILVALLALVIAVGSQTFLGACVHEDGSFGACHWAARGILGVGGLMAALALLAIAARRARFGLYLAMLPADLVGILIPGTLIDICGMDTMRCRMLMRPATMILFALAMIAALVGLLLSRNEAR